MHQLCCTVLCCEVNQNCYILASGIISAAHSPHDCNWLPTTKATTATATLLPILIKSVEQCEPGEQSFPRGLIQDIACHAADLTDPVVISGHVDDEFICRLNFTGAAFGKCWLLFGIIFAPKQMEHNCTELASLWGVQTSTITPPLITTLAFIRYANHRAALFLALHVIPNYWFSIFFADVYRVFSMLQFQLQTRICRYEPLCLGDGWY